MINIILGAVAVFLGIWGMLSNWWATVDLVRTVCPIILAVYGVVALIAGLKRFFPGKTHGNVEHYLED